MDTVKDDDFAAKVMQAKTPVLLDFSASWCGPCQALGPVLEAMAPDYAGRLAFFKVDIDDAPETANKFGIMGVPTMVVLKGGEVVDQRTGALPRAKVEQWLETALK
ncbi:thioredoxin [Alphaproteobacteria bacterium]|nr:thioredoxin [Alphaproteobacteria bacterium]